MSQQSRALITTLFVVIALVTFVYVNNIGSKTQLIENSQNKDNVVIAYQTGVDPTKVAQANADYERDSKNNIEWKKFDTGADIVNALASGDVDIGNIGTSPLAAAASRNVPIQVFLAVSKLGTSEALVVRQGSGIKTPQDFVGKTIAVPFVSTAHYSLLSALKHWGLSDHQVKIVNLRPSEISAAWERGDIDATYVWEPALSKAAETGQVLTDSSQVGEWGAPTYDVWVVRQQFAEKHPEFLKSFVTTSFKQIDEYNRDPKAYVSNTEHIQKIAALTGSNAKDIPVLLAGNHYLSRAQHIETFKQSFAVSIADTARFLKSQGKVDVVKPDYNEHVTSEYLQP